MWLYSSVTHCLSCVVLRGLLSCHRATRPDVFTSWPFSEQVLTPAPEDRRHQNSRRVCRRRLTVSHPFSCVGSIFPLRGQRGQKAMASLLPVPSTKEQVPTQSKEAELSPPGLAMSISIPCTLARRPCALAAKSRVSGPRLGPGLGGPCPNQPDEYGWKAEIGP